MFRALLACTLLLLLYAQSHGQDPYFINFNTAHGLPSSQVYRVGFDPHGMPWFATDRGVCRYNGYEFITYSTLDGLANNTLLDIHMGPEGKLWFLGLDGSISFLDQGEFKPFSQNQQLFDVLGHFLISGMEWEPDGKMYLWCHDRKVRVLCFDPETEKFTEISLEDEFMQSRRSDVGALSLYALGDGYFPSKYTTNILTMPDGTVYHDMVRKNGILYQGNLNDPEFSFQLELGALINKLYMDDLNNLLVSTSSGLYKFPNGDLQSEPEILFPGVPFSSVVQDAEGNFWLTTLEKGIYLVPSFDFHKMELPGGAGKYTTVTSMVALEDHLFFGSMGGRIYATNKELNTELMFSSDDSYGHFPYASKHGNKAFIGTFEVGEENGKPTISPPSHNRNNPVTLRLENGDLFLGTLVGYLIYADGQINSAFLSKLPFRIHSALELGNRIYLGTLKGLWYIEDYDFANPQPLKVGPNGDQLRINDLEKDMFGNVWVASIGEGLAYLADGKQYYVGLAEGLSSNMVNKVAVGEPGTLYVATNAGVNRVVYEWENGFQVKEIKRLSTEEGLPGNFVQDLAYWNGALWLATQEGLSYCAPEVMDERNLPRIPILLEEVMVNRKVMDKSLAAELKHNENDVAIHFLGMSMRKPRNKPFYRYRLQTNGSSVPWEYTNDRTVRYMNLSAGDYTFEVAAQNRNGEWSEQAATYAFVIRPHFSNTLWFQSLVLLLVLGLLVGMAYISLRRVRQKAAQKRRLQEARLKAQEAEITALRNQMNPHFVFNALNSIQNFIFKNDIRQANFYLSKFSKLMRDGLRFSRKKMIPLEEEIVFLTAYLDLETMRFPGRFSYALEVDQALDLSRAMVPPFLIQPLLENAVKHAFKDIDYPGQLLVQFQYAEPDLLEVEIRDNGPGFVWQKQQRNENPHQSMGLQIVQDRITLLNAERQENKARFEMTNLQSIGENGMQAQFSIPFNLNSNG